jgi:hypothetical protein
MRRQFLSYRREISTVASNIAIALCVAFLISASQVNYAQAEPTGRVSSGATQVTFASSFSQALRSLELGVSIISPGRQRDGLIRFPVRNGQLDTANLKGEIIHEGGLRLTNGTAAVDLLNFIIDTSGSNPVLTGFVRVNNSAIGRIPLFSLALRDPAVSRFGRFLNLNNVTVTLRPEAAAALNDVFNTRALSSSTLVGTAAVNSRLTFSLSSRPIQ